MARDRKKDDDDEMVEINPDHWRDALDTTLWDAEIATPDD